MQNGRDLRRLQATNVGALLALRQAHKQTRLCKFFAAGACTRGAACTFAHGSERLRQQPNFARLGARPSPPNGPEEDASLRRLHAEGHVLGRRQLHLGVPVGYGAIGGLRQVRPWQAGAETGLGGEDRPPAQVPGSGHQGGVEP